MGENLTVSPAPSRPTDFSRLHYRLSVAPVNSPRSNFSGNTGAENFGFLGEDCLSTTDTLSESWYLAKPVSRPWATGPQGIGPSPTLQDAPGSTIGAWVDVSYLPAVGASQGILRDCGLEPVGHVAVDPQIAVVVDHGSVAAGAG